MKKLLTILFLLLSFGLSAQINENVLRMPKDTSRFGKTVIALQLVAWTDTTVSGYATIYRLYCNMTSTQSIRTAISNGCAKVIGGSSSGVVDTTSLSNRIDNKVDKDGGKVLSDNNFTDSLNAKLNGLDSGQYVKYLDSLSKYVTPKMLKDSSAIFIRNGSSLFSWNQGGGATNAFNSNFIGTFAGKGATNASSSNFIGIIAGYGATDAYSSNFIGVSAGYGATNAYYSNFIGVSAGRNAINAESSNFLGNSAGFGATDAKRSNFLGLSTGQGAINASYSFLAGYSTGRTYTGNNIGANNIIIGTNISLPDLTANAINLGGVIYATGTADSIYNSNPSIYPKAGAKVGIGVVNPLTTLQVNGKVFANNIDSTNKADIALKQNRADTNTNSNPITLNYFNSHSGSTLDTNYIYKAIGAKLDSNIFYNQDTLVKEPTGFTNNDAIQVVYDSTQRKITLTGSFEAYYKGRKIAILTNGYVSPAHSTTYNKTYYLHYNGAIVFDTVQWAFDEIQIASVWYGTSDRFALRETHGFMPNTVHATLHYTIGTYLISGGDVSGITFNSTTAAQRRPTISQAIIEDEDLESIDTAKAVGQYTLRYLSGSLGTRNLTTNAADIIPLLTNNPYYNAWDGANWVQTLFPNNAYGAIFLIALPTANSSNSQRYRFQFIQPQQVSTTLATIQGLNSTNVNLGLLSSEEYVFIGKIIVRYAASNWTIIQYDKITGSKVNQTSSTGGYLSSVSTDGTLTGVGTGLSPLSVVKSVWVDVAGTPTRASSTTFTTTGDLTSYVAKSMVIKWTESSTIRCGMVSIPSTFGSPNTTVTIIGDTIVAAGFNVGSVKYYMGDVSVANFAIAGTIGATDTALTNTYCSTYPMRVLGADIWTSKFGTTNNTTADINKKYSISGTMFGVKPTLATTVASSPTPFTATTYTSLALGDKVFCDIDAIQTTSCQDLFIKLYLFPTRLLNLP